MAIGLRPSIDLDFGDSAPGSAFIGIELVQASPRLSEGLDPFLGSTGAPVVSPTVVPRPILDCPTLNEVSPVAMTTDVALDARPEVSDVSNFSVQSTPAVCPLLTCTICARCPGSEEPGCLVAPPVADLCHVGGRRRETPDAASLQRWDGLLKEAHQNQKYRV
jgi:hypothetical protein